LMPLPPPSATANGQAADEGRKPGALPKLGTLIGDHESEISVEETRGLSALALALQHGINP